MVSKRITLKDEEEKKRIREILRSLDRIKAPWYFDAELEQRLRGKINRTPNRRWPWILGLVAALLVLGGAIAFFSGLLDISLFVWPARTGVEHESPAPRVTFPAPSVQSTAPVQAKPAVTKPPEERPIRVPEPVVVDSSRIRASHRVVPQISDTLSALPDSEKSP